MMSTKNPRLKYSHVGMAYHQAQLGGVVWPDSELCSPWGLVGAWEPSCAIVEEGLRSGPRFCKPGSNVTFAQTASGARCSFFVGGSFPVKATISTIVVFEKVF